MWTLRTAAASPFGRKVRIAAALCGLSDRLVVKTADPADPADSLRRENPLGKIPALVLEDRAVLYDSRVIVEFLDLQAGGNIVIPTGSGRIAVLTLQALADGLMDASLLRLYEGRWRPPDQHNTRWLDHQKGKVERALANLESGPPMLSGRPNVGEIALACALGYLDFRFAGEWRADHPRLVAWLGDFAAAVPSFETTRPS